MGYQQDFRRLSMAFSDHMDFKEWADIYKKLVYWDIEIDRSPDKSMAENFEGPEVRGQLLFFHGSLKTIMKIG